MQDNQLAHAKTVIPSIQFRAKMHPSRWPSRLRSVKSPSEMVMSRSVAVKANRLGRAKRRLNQFRIVLIRDARLA